MRLNERGCKRRFSSDTLIDRHLQRAIQAQESRNNMNTSVTQEFVRLSIASRLDASRGIVWQQWSGRERQ